MSKEIPKTISFSDYPHAGETEVPAQASVSDGFAYTRDEVQDALGRGSDKFTLNVIEVDLKLPELE